MTDTPTNAEVKATMEFTKLLLGAAGEVPPKIAMTSLIMATSFAAKIMNIPLENATDMITKSLEDTYANELKFKASLN